MILRLLLVLVLFSTPVWGAGGAAKPKAPVASTCLRDFRRQMEAGGRAVGVADDGSLLRTRGEIGAGGGGAAYLVESHKEGRSIQFQVFRQSLNSKSEKDGMAIHRELSAMYVAENTPPSGQYVMPVLQKARMKVGNTTIEGDLMPWGGSSFSDLVDDLTLNPHGEFPHDLEDDPGLKIRRNARAMADLVHGLGDLWRKKIVHRDLKNDNLLLHGGKVNSVEEFDQGLAHAAIIDLGFATREGSPVEQLVGTPGAMEPALLADSPPPATRMSDVYSVASLLIENLLGLDVHYAEMNFPHLVEYGIPGIYDSIRYKRSAVEAALNALKFQWGTAKVSQEDLALFDDLVRFAVNGIIPDPVAREAALAADPHSILRMGQYGANPEFEARIPGYRPKP